MHNTIDMLSLRTYCITSDYFIKTLTIELNSKLQMKLKILQYILMEINQLLQTINSRLRMYESLIYASEGSSNLRENASGDS